ncbi:MAG: hypothetical protein R3C68_03380 [Myxococcota bacterium]
MRICLHVAILFGLVACRSPQKTPNSSSVPTQSADPAVIGKPAEEPHAPPGFLLLSQAQFTWEVDGSGKRRPKPGPAKLVILTRKGAGWRTETIEDADSRVFHKAVCTGTGEFGPEILTIGGTDASEDLENVRQGGWDNHWRIRVSVGNGTGPLSEILRLVMLTTTG